MVRVIHLRQLLELAARLSAGLGAVVVTLQVNIAGKYQCIFPM